MLKSVQHNPGMFTADPDKLRPLEKWIMKIEGQILDGLIFDVRELSVKVYLINECDF